MRSRLAWILGLALGCGGSTALAQPVSVNRDMARMAEGSPLYRHARQAVERNTAALADPVLVRETREALLEPGACIHHRIGLGAQEEDAIVTRLKASGFLPQTVSMEAARGGLFPGVAGEGGACPHLLWPVLTAAGGNSHSHHSWPGGLAEHIAGNLARGARLARAYPRADSDGWRAAILWHDWAKALVLPWQADGMTRPELTVAGTGAHHILGLAEAMRAGLPARQIADQACAHALPGADGQPVRGWLQAAAIIAGRPATAVPVPALTPACRINFAADQGWVQDDAALLRAERRLRRARRSQRSGVWIRNAVLACWGTAFPASAAGGLKAMRCGRPRM
ncbi:hypothetical protein [Novosphingobium terrae]|uniref:hypothetical protein n=1 Tax=Novosphingobium terrae TaxID=2726189 RepID=UPI00197D8EDC|nr:hypothetical protein [Novosphingobium terrae]